MATARGSKQRLTGIKETTPGVTPTTPALIEFPVNSFGRTFSNTPIRSAQIRSHPFVDKLLRGQSTQEFELAFELQDDTHDTLLDVLTGTTTWSSNLLKITDSLQTMTLQSQATDLALYDRLVGAFITRAEFTFPAAADALITASMSGRALSSVIDSATAITGATLVSAPSNDPYIFGDASLTVGGVATSCTSARLTIERDVDDLLVLGQYNAKEEVPSSVRVTGSVTVPYDGFAQATRFVNFTAGSIVLSAADASGGTSSRVFTVPNTKYVSLGKRYEGRGVMMQEINWEAFYDPTSATVMSITRT